VTQTPIPKKAEADLIFAWKVVKHTRSNAIVIARDLTTVGIGAGQTSRIDAVENALQKGSKKLESTVLASEAFFPFRDNIDCLKGLGISAVIQPGGSIKDSEVISACNELGIAMVFTGVRHFKH
jgi:phosphoribosylaminoimidazolecarboxamide formyltransferase/IMP cyclohydrolase